MSPAINPALSGTLTAEKFHDAVLELKPSVAVFDCDGTLWSGDAGSGFMHWTVETGLLSQGAVEWLNERYGRYERGEVSEAEICGEMVQVYHGLAESEVRRSAAQFFATKVESNIFPEMAALIRKLQQVETAIWAVSSTNNWVIEEGMRRFDILPGRVLSARVAVREGIISNELLDVPTDEGKVFALQRAGIAAPDCVFGNSIHDAAMLGIARRPFAVNPTAGLLGRSAAEGWPVYLPASVRAT